MTRDDFKNRYRVFRLLFASVHRGALNRDTPTSTAAYRILWDALQKEPPVYYAIIGRSRRNYKYPLRGVFDNPRVAMFANTRDY